MVTVRLSDDPVESDFEDLVAAHFASRGCFVDTNVTERDPRDVLELDVLWTDYSAPRPCARPIEVKSGQWGLNDVFKFAGWMKYLSLTEGTFVHRLQPKNTESLLRVCERLGISTAHVPNVDGLSAHLDAFGLRAPAEQFLPALWRFAYAAQRRLIESIHRLAKVGRSGTTVRKAQEYHRLINDALFFEADPRRRFERLVRRHFDHPKLAAELACEMEGLAYNEGDLPPTSATFTAALYDGKHFPVQAALYLAHRARLQTVRAAVDLTLGREAGTLMTQTFRLKLRDGTILEFPDPSLTPAFKTAMNRYAQHAWLRLLPGFWQTYLWSWGGFILLDRKDREYQMLADETQVPVEAVAEALDAFDAFFQTPGGWHRSVHDRRVLTVMPAAIRGIGAWRRLKVYGVSSYSELGVDGTTASHLASDHEAAIRLLDPETDLTA